MQLVIMAAGMGSRFGGLKQMEPMDAAGNFLLDYSIYDAKRAGFDSVVFIIKKDFYEDFKNTIGARVSKTIKVEYVFQDLNDIPSEFKVPEGREKPWGTAHALYAARDAIKEDFIIINGDDFYGKETYEVAYNYLKNEHKKGEYANIAFNVAKTMTENGAVKRGVCFLDKNGYLEKLVESSIDRNEKGQIECTPLEGGDKFIASEDALVSMNFFAFDVSLVEELKRKFPLWLKDNASGLKTEFLIPSVVDELVKEGRTQVKVLNSPCKWFGVTYKEDKPFVVKSIKELTKQGVYKEGLY